jgi:hypothetical protein
MAIFFLQIAKLTGQVKTIKNLFAKQTKTIRLKAYLKDVQINNAELEQDGIIRYMSD